MGNHITNSRSVRSLQRRGILDTSLSDFLFIASFLLLLFEDPLSSIIPIAGYSDELFAAMGIVLHFLGTNRMRIGLLLPVSLYIACGLIGSIINSYQPHSAVLTDAFLNMKFFFAIGFGMSIAETICRESLCLLGRAAKTLTLLLSALLMANYLFGLFPGQEIRFGFQIPKLFFSHSEYLAGFQVILLALGLMNDARRDGIGFYIWIVFAIANIAVTFRYKALTAALFALLVVFVVVIKNKRFSRWNYILLGVIAVFMSWDQILEYYANTVTARGALTASSLEIAVDCFPFGTGFATFGSYMSKVFYSPVYYQYGLSGIYGLMNIEGAGSFISDTFWPMVIGQSGIAGFICYLWALIALYKRIESLYYSHQLAYCSALFLFVYLLIQSTASASFVGPVSVPIGIVIGICLPMSKKEASVTSNRDIDKTTTFFS